MRFDSVQLSTGPRLHYAEQGDTAGEAVLFLHGWPDSWFTYSRVLDLLSPQFLALVPDQRGFGESDKPESGYGIDVFAEDAVAFLDALEVERATIVGHSFGSFVTRQMAITHPERVARLVLIGSGVTAGTPVVLDAQAVTHTLQDRVSVEFAREFQSGTAYVPLPAPFFERLVFESMKLPARLWRETIDKLIAHRDPAPLSAIAAPTLLLWGEHDALFSREHQDQLVAGIPGARLIIYPETGHCPNWERPERVAADLQAFLQSSLNT